MNPHAENRWGEDPIFWAVLHVSVQTAIENTDKLLYLEAHGALNAMTKDLPDFVLKNHRPCRVGCT